VSNRLGNHDKGNEQMYNNFSLAHDLDPKLPSVSRTTESVKIAEEGALQRERVVILGLTILPFIGLVIAIASFWQRGVTWVDLGVMAFTYLITGFGITIGYHRLLTHGSFETAPWLRAAFAIAGSMAVEGPIVRWVADHRRHHAFADKQGDPHSPHLSERSGRGEILRDLWYAHIGWFFDREKTRVSKFAPDLLADRTIRAIDRLYLVWVAASLALPAGLGWILTGTAAGALSALLWGGFVRIFFVHHSTWSINSICHTFGQRPFDTHDRSANTWWLAIPALGEAWHNAHHAFPTSARHGLGRFEIDLSAGLIEGLEKIGLAWNIKMPTARQLDAKTLPSQRQ
jgi:stearoyl-CoA desaturase (delta-9 desaturase)